VRWGRENFAAPLCRDWERIDSAAGIDDAAGTAGLCARRTQPSRQGTARWREA